MTISTFSNYIESLGNVTSVSGKASYNNIYIKDDFVYFIREGKSEEEKISLFELYDFYNNAEDFTTTEALKFISGRVQSPATAIVKAIWMEKQRKAETIKGKISNFFEDNSVSQIFGKLGCLTLIILFLIACIQTCLSDEDNSLPVPNEELLVTRNSVAVYEEGMIDRMEELCKNQDGVGMMLLVDAGNAAFIDKNDKCLYVRYIKGGYYVVKSYNNPRPLIVRKTDLSKIK